MGRFRRRRKIRSRPGHRVSSRLKKLTSSRSTAWAPRWVVGRRPGLPTVDWFWGRATQPWGTPAPPDWTGLGSRLAKPPLHLMEPLGAPRPQALGVPWGLPEAPSYSIKASQAPVARLTPHFPDTNQGWEMSCWPPAPRHPHPPQQLSSRQAWGLHPGRAPAGPMGPKTLASGGLGVGDAPSSCARSPAPP